MSGGFFANYVLLSGATIDMKVFMLFKKNSIKGLVSFAAHDAASAAADRLESPLLLMQKNVFVATLFDTPPASSECYFLFHFTATTAGYNVVCKPLQSLGFGRKRIYCPTVPPMGN